MEEHAGFKEPEIILPIQYYSALTRSPTETHGEWRLLFAVLADAVRCFQRGARSVDLKDRQLFAEAAAWIMEEDDSNADPASAPEAGFSFADVCTALRIDPGFLRTRLRRWYRAQCGDRCLPRHSA